MNSVLKYFPDLPDQVKAKIDEYENLITGWNKKVNLVSRKDIEKFKSQHILNSLLISNVITFPPESKIIDIGTGGGLPGVPLSIMFPDSEFTLLDSRKNKTSALRDICEKLKLKNVQVIKNRSEQHRGKYDYITGRAVTAFPIFIDQTKHLFSYKSKAMNKGVYYLKGGDTDEDKAAFPDLIEYPLKEIVDEEYFETKKLLYLGF